MKTTSWARMRSGVEMYVLQFETAIKKACKF
jgi:hypothetical protein